MYMYTILYHYTYKINIFNCNNVIITTIIITI